MDRCCMVGVTQFETKKAVVRSRTYDIRPYPQAMFRGCFAWILRGVWGGVLCATFWGGGIASADADMTACVRLLRSEKFEEAVSCMEAQYKEARSAYNLRSLALFYEKAGFASSRRGDKRLARYYWRLSTRSYRDFLEQSGESLTLEDRKEIEGKLQNFVMFCGFAKLSVRSNAVGARLILTGYRFREEGFAPAQFQELVPGSYRLRAVHPAYKTAEVSFKLRPQASSDYVIRLEDKPPSERRKVAVVRKKPTGPRPKGPGLTPFWIALGVTVGLGAAAATTHVLARNRWDEAGARSLLAGSGYRESYDQAQGLYISSVSFYVGAGLAAAAAVGMITWHLLLPPEEEIACKTNQATPQMLGANRSSRIFGGSCLPRMGQMRSSRMFGGSRSSRIFGGSRSSRMLRANRSSRMCAVGSFDWCVEVW